MVKNLKSPVTYAKMKGMMSHFSAVIKERKAFASDLMLKLVSSPKIYRRFDSHGFLRPEEDGANALCLRDASLQKVTAADFDYLKVIGTGSFGKVMLARHKESEKYYAVKVLQKHTILQRKEQHHIMCERSVLLRALHHPFLIRLHYCFQTNDKLYFVLDYASGGELFYHLQREQVFLEPRARFYAAEIASALGYLHALDIIYRDLKLENVLLDRHGHILLTDFGLCKEGVDREGRTGTFCGTPEYLPPEVLEQKDYDRTTDWWALGVVLHEMLYGQPPFFSESRSRMLQNILHQPLVLKPGVSKSARDLLHKLLEKAPKRRLQNIAELECHPFFSSINWIDLVAKKVRPPFRPSVSGPTDLVNFDPEFTQLPVPPSLGACEGSGLAFPGFSYTCENVSSPPRRC
ncbi:hypothetical protein ACEWY4_019466 [Coilia grayii]|uniref:Uncharacterized protein n=1 Tax=Coilia grayii TaxID=363190 RepID=A0ABD1J9T5_9TELE